MAGSTLRSDTPLTGPIAVPPQPDAVPDVDIVHLAVTPSADGGTVMRSEPWITGVLLDDAVVFATRGVSVRITTDGRSIGWFAEPGTSDAVTGHVLLDIAVPAAIAFTGAVVLHATAVVVGSTAIGFLGSSGAGKSTVAIAVARAGEVLLADDCLRVELLGSDGVIAHPSYPVSRLLGDSADAMLGQGEAGEADATGKVRVDAGSVGIATAQAPVRLGALIALDRSSDLNRVASLEPLSRVRGFMAIADQRLDIDLPSGVHERIIERFAIVAERVPVYRLRYRSSYDRLPEVVAAVRALAATQHG